jgi:hypothetical protein
VRTVQPRNLNGCLTDPAAAGQHQDDVPALNGRERHEHVPRGQEGQGKRRGLDEADVIGNRYEVFDGNGNQLRVASVRLQPEHVVTDAQIVASARARSTGPAMEPGLQEHSRSGSHWPTAVIHDLAGDVAARDMRQRNRDPIESATLPQIDVIQGARPDPHDRASW